MRKSWCSFARWKIDDERNRRGKTSSGSSPENVRLVELTSNVRASPRRIDPTEQFRCDKILRQSSHSVLNENIERFLNRSTRLRCNTTARAWWKLSEAKNVTSNYLNIRRCTARRCSSLVDGRGGIFIGNNNVFSPWKSTGWSIEKSYRTNWSELFFLRRTSRRSARFRCVARRTPESFSLLFKSLIHRYSDQWNEVFPSFFSRHSKTTSINRCASVQTVTKNNNFSVAAAMTFRCFYVCNERSERSEAMAMKKEKFSSIQWVIERFCKKINEISERFIHSFATLFFLFSSPRDGLCDMRWLNVKCTRCCYWCPTRAQKRKRRIEFFSACFFSSLSSKSKSIRLLVKSK